MITKWEELEYWETGEWQVIQERYDNMDQEFNPGVDLLFANLEAIHPNDVKVVFAGQDPYPDKKYCTGHAFSTFATTNIPPALDNIFKELETDLHLPRPLTGDLTPWVRQGVLLWNVIPSCETGHSLSHDWVEWIPLNEELFWELSGNGIVFVLVGSKARAYRNCIQGVSRTIEVAHPSPRASKRSMNPFCGSRVFSRVNAELVSLGRPTIDWSLNHAGYKERTRTKT
jgi:uracil-DNA glycosylase